MQHPPARGADPFFDRLVRRLDPHAAAPPRAEPVICGRWLLLRRLAAGLDPEALAARAGLAPEAVLLLEAGIADAALAPEGDWERLAAMLAAGRHDLPQVRAALRVALRGATPDDAGALARVRADLRAAYAGRQLPAPAWLVRLQDDARGLGESPLLLALHDDLGEYDTFSGRVALYEAYVARRLPALARAAGKAAARQALERAAFEEHGRSLAPPPEDRAPRPELRAPSLREFLAACHLAAERELVALAYGLWQSAEGERWRNVLLLLAEGLQQRRQLPERGLAWLNALLSETTPGGAHKAPAQRWRDALLAAASYAGWAAAPNFDEHLAPAPPRAR